MAKRMRKMNRTVKLTLDIPDDFDSDEDFMIAFRDRLDDNEWSAFVGVGAEEIAVNLRGAQMGDIAIEPEDEDE